MRDVGILGPEDPAQARPRELVLAVGVRGRALLPVLRPRALPGRRAVAIKLDGPGQAAMLGEVPWRPQRTASERIELTGRHISPFASFLSWSPRNRGDDAATPLHE